MHKMQYISSWLDLCYVRETQSIVFFSIIMWSLLYLQGLENFWLGSIHLLMCLEKLLLKYAGANI